MIIYLDVDDVVADWYTAAQEYLKIKWRREDNYRIPYDEWIRLKNASRFYRDLPLKEHAHELVNWCQAYCDTNPGTELRFLTAIPHNNDMPWAIQDKVWWCHQHFPGIPCFLGPYSEDKQTHCRPGDILIDDRTTNCEQWQAAGGLSHIYTDWHTCEKWLLEVLINGRTEQAS